MDPRPPPPSATPEAAPAPLVGAVVGGRFEVVGLVASGTMGRVYRAVQHPLGREVALKILHTHPAHVREADYRDRFLREASALARLHHANTVRIFDFGIWEHRSFLVMELVHGLTLGEVLRDGPLEPLRAIAIARQTCASLREAHAQGIVHRDLKPGNILLCDHGDDPDFVKVVDFGLVKDSTQADDLARVGQLVGSPQYMSPEQIRGEEVDGRADLYSLGVVLFRALTGRAAFPEKQTAAVLVSHLTRPAPTLQEARPELGVPPALEWTVARCLEKDRAERFADARQLARALMACQLALLDPALWDIELSLRDGVVVLPAALNDLSLSTSTSQLLIADSLLPGRLPEVRAPREDAGTEAEAPAQVAVEEPTLSTPSGVGLRLAPVVLGALVSVLLGLLAVLLLAPELLIH